MPPHHARTLRERTPATQSQKWRWGSLSVVIVVAAVVVILATTGGSGRVKKGCIDVIVPSITGAQAIDQCGSAARATCANGGVNGMFNTNANGTDALARACRTAGLPLKRA